MARILYGVAGEGSGHSTRAKEIISHLLDKGHEVKVVSYDRGYKNLSPFFDVTEISGLGFVYRNNKVKQIETIFKNLQNSPKIAKSYEKVFKLFNAFQPQIVISDFEPISANCANLKKIPLISIDNQRLITGTKIEYPKKYRGEAFAAKVVTELMVQKAKKYLTITFVDTKITDKKVELFPPILRKEVLATKPNQGDYILVYLTSEFKNILEIFKSIRKKFIVYGFNQDKIDSNITLKKASQVSFLKDLAGSQGVIANSGFSLISEALYLGKPYLAIPVAKQFEQVINAYYLEKLGYGKYWDELNKERIESFLYNLDFYTENLAKYKKEDNSKILAAVDALIEKYT